MHRIALAAAAALSMAILPTAFAADMSGSAGNPGAQAKTRHAMHYRSSSAAPLAVDERSMADAREQRQTRAMNLIGAAGYDDFADMTPDGRNFHATAIKGGQRISVLVDPDNGRVTPQ